MSPPPAAVASYRQPPVAATKNRTPLLVRDADEITGRDAQGNVHRERPRSASRFIQFIRDELRGGMTPSAYFESDGTPWSATTESMRDSVSLSVFLPAATAVCSATS